MTTIAVRRRGAVSAAEPGARTVALVAVIAGAATLIVRLVLRDRAFDLLGDEVVYTDIGRSVFNGGFPRFGGQLFFLHGPGFFYLEAGWEHLLGPRYSLMSWIYEMRSLNALLAAATAGAAVLLATRAGSLRTGAVAGLLLALDPFCIRQNDRVMLETALMLWVLLGYLVFTSLIGRSPSRHDWLRAVGAGLLFGCAVLTKDEGALLTVLPLLAAAALRWGPRRGLTLLTAGTTVAVYASYVAIVTASGAFAAFWQAKTSGLRRLLGVEQTTGFHSAGGGSLSSRLIAEGPYFVTTYAVLALAVLAVVPVLRRGGPVARILGLLYCAAAVALGYAVTLGTLEEQELYLLIVPSLLILPVAARLLPGASRAPAGRRRATPRTALVVAAALVLAVGVNLATCVQWFRQPDDGFARLLSYMAVHVPAGSKVTGAAGNYDVAQYALVGRYNVGLWLTSAALSRDHVRYVVVEWGEINEGYSSLTPPQVRNLVGHGQPVFSFDGRTYGHLVLYRLPVPAQNVLAR
jgi:4-amino-4-deoxy-L-arabinose transferase-like glycosyltransferase